MTDPTAIFDQLGATLRLEAELISSYYGHLRANKIPPPMARQLTLQMQERLLGAMIPGGTDGNS